MGREAGTGGHERSRSPNALGQRSPSNRRARALVFSLATGSHTLQPRSKHLDGTQRTFANDRNGPKANRRTTRMQRSSI